MAITKVNSLSRSAQCVSCGAELEAGQQVYCDTEDNSIWCQSCMDKATSMPSPPAGAVPGPSADGQDIWNRFFRYQADCLKADLIDGLVPINGNNWVCSGDSCEGIITQGERLLPLDADLDRLVANMRPGDSLQYGWPLVAVETAEGLKVSPLLVVDLASPPYTVGTASVLSEPVINPAILRALWSHSGDITFLRSQMSEGLPSGAVAISRFVQHILDVMGIQYPELDPYALRREMPTAPGVYNTAVTVAAQSLPAATRTVTVLKDIANRTDWQGTSSACLFGVELEDSGDHDGMPVMPWSAEPLFEDALQMIRHRPLTVFDMPQRDVVDQLIVSSCANILMDNESVLVVSDDEKKLDELATLANDVHPALLIRTVTDRDLEAAPNRKANPLSSLAGVLLDELRSASGSIKQILERSYKDLQVVEGLRRTALDGHKKHAELSQEKQALEVKRLELAKRLWIHGLYPSGTDPYELGQRAKQLSRSWFCKKFRTKLLLRDMKAKSSASLQEVLDWCLSSLAIKDLEKKMSGSKDPDKFNVGAANYRWAASSISAVSARVSSSLPGCMQELEDLRTVRQRENSTKEIISSLLPHLRAWATDYYSAEEFFDLKAGMFDTVIFDNANRVNLCWALPLAYRAKRVVVISDSASQPPSVFLDSLQLGNMAKRYEFERSSMIERNLDYMNSSVYTAFDNA